MSPVRHIKLALVREAAIREHYPLSQIMSALRPKAEIETECQKSPLLARSGHSFSYNLWSVWLWNKVFHDPEIYSRIALESAST